MADLISVPFQFNYNRGFFEGNGDRSYLNIQPVIPFSISRDWNVISRTILPIYSQERVIPGAGSQFGLGATTQSFFFSPKEPTKAGLVWGVGPPSCSRPRPTTSRRTMGRGDHRRRPRPAPRLDASAVWPTTSGR